MEAQAGRNLEPEQPLGHLLVKSRPRQKLPTQSRTVHLLETPPSPAPPRLQLMAAAAPYPVPPPSSSSSRPGLSSSPPRSNPWGETELDVEGRRDRGREGGALGSWAFSVSVAAAAAHLAFHVGEGSVDATRSRVTDGRSVMPGQCQCQSTGTRHLPPPAAIKLTTH